MDALLGRGGENLGPSSHVAIHKQRRKGYYRIFFAGRSLHGNRRSHICETVRNGKEKERFLLFNRTTLCMRFFLFLPLFLKICPTVVSMSIISHCMDFPPMMAGLLLVLCLYNHN